MTNNELIAALKVAKPSKQTFTPLPDNSGRGTPFHFNGMPIIFKKRES